MKSYIVVGAGILGASTAYHLAKAGANVIIVDRQQVGQATDAAAGIVCPWLSQRRNKAWYKIVKGGARYYSSLIQQLEDDGETDTGYNRVGAISLHTDEKNLIKWKNERINVVKMPQRLVKLLAYQLKKQKNYSQHYQKNLVLFILVVLQSKWKIIT